MKPVSRGEILDLGAYEEIRERFRARIMEEKKRRRVALGPNMSVLFENHDTALFQIQEMIRTERITKESSVVHEIETYNELVPADDELSITLFVEYPEPQERERMLTALAGLERRVYAVVAGERIAFVGAARGARDDRTTAVHYLKLPLSGDAVRAVQAPGADVRIGVDHPAYAVEVALPPATLSALVDDLAEP